MSRPSTIHRITKTTARQHNISGARMALEACMRRAGEALSPERLASLSGIDEKSVRRLLQNMRVDGLGVNVGTRSEPRWRLRFDSAAQVPARISNAQANGTYDGAELRPFDKRPGAMDFKQWPSRGLR